MSKTILTVVALSALALPAFAQSSSSPSTPNNPSMSSSTTPSSSSTPSQDVVSTQKPDQWLASRLKGTDVIGPDNAKIGDINDIVLDRSGAVAALVVGVGGFLGIGAKDVALTMAAFQVVSGKDGQPDQLRVSMTKEQLKDAPEFKPYQTASNTMTPSTSTPRAPVNAPSTPPATSPTNTTR